MPAAGRALAFAGDDRRVRRWDPADRHRDGDRAGPRCGTRRHRRRRLAGHRPGRRSPRHQPGPVSPRPALPAVRTSDRPRTFAV